MLLKCISGGRAQGAIEEMHDGICGNHVGSKALFGRKGACAVVRGVAWRAKVVSKLTILAGVLFFPCFKTRGEASEAVSELSLEGLELTPAAPPYAV